MTIQIGTQRIDGLTYGAHWSEPSRGISGHHVRVGDGPWVRGRESYDYEGMTRDDVVDAIVTALERAVVEAREGDPYAPDEWDAAWAAPLRELTKGMSWEFTNWRHMPQVARQIMQRAE